jgi:hypothetical protein
MPIKPVSGPVAGRICSISAVSSCSASGNGWPGMFAYQIGALGYHELPLEGERQFVINGFHDQIPGNSSTGGDE